MESKAWASCEKMCACVAVVGRPRDVELAGMDRLNFCFVG
jgi:hypothetical protein